MTKTISLADDAYADLVRVKMEGESFSGLARRLAKKAALEDLFDPGLRIDMSEDEARRRKADVHRSRADPRNERRRR